MLFFFFVFAWISLPRAVHLCILTLHVSTKHAASFKARVLKNKKNMCNKWMNSCDSHLWCSHKWVKVRHLEDACFLFISLLGEIKWSCWEKEEEGSRRGYGRTCLVTASQPLNFMNPNYVFSLMLIIRKKKPILNGHKSDSSSGF